ncbi:hypothetical protein POJ06DRAFT_245726 [Lipomyces tetrasporus]|uniref:Secreted protein n=1 Tax=Lipomyces tetrasporus TaxID=54092 RepID=A0AAD7VW02_9ASCO|nr:uncharacterized protein POJ06DRAFT_245726 [Lipomyces tetrasporus]KAJ8102820.1 hypothetical protein POJ06DRAFT_245726 [Lipomyces tetrasporus]
MRLAVPSFFAYMSIIIACPSCRAAKRPCLTSPKTTVNGNNLASLTRSLDTRTNSRCPGRCFIDDVDGSVLNTACRSYKLSRAAVFLRTL